MVDSQKKVKARMTALKTSSRGKSNISFRMEIVESDTAKYKKKPCGEWNEWQSPRLTKWSK